MVGLWSRLRGKATPDTGGGALARMLADYPPNRPRHPGDAASLSDAERDANLAQFLAERDRRLEILSGFLRGHGLDPSPMLRPDGDGAAAARAIDRWLDATLPRRPMTILGDAAPNPPWPAFRASDNAGPCIFYSLIADLALLEGEAIRIRDGRFAWRVNRLKGFRDMSDYHRICLIKPGATGWAATVLDMPALLLAICHRKAQPGGDAGGHVFGELLEGAMRRAFDP